MALSALIKEINLKLIAIVGKKRSGKDTAAQHIENKWPSTTFLYALANPIKEALDHGYINSFSNENSGVDLNFKDWDGEGTDREAPLLLSNKNVYILVQESLRFLEQYYGLPKKQLDAVMLDIKIKIMGNKNPWSIRRLMQLLGTDIVVDLIDQHFWNRQMMNAFFDADKAGGQRFIVTDLRQVHEIAIARDLGAQIIHVERDEINKSQTDSHITEAGLPVFPGETVISNNGTLEEFQAKILEVVQ